MPTVAPASTFVVVDTQFVVPPRAVEAPYYELVVAPDQGADARRLTLVTRDLAAVARALQVEGTEARVAVTWRRGRRLSRPVLVLEALEAVS